MVIMTKKKYNAMLDDLKLTIKYEYDAANDKIDKNALEIEELDAKFEKFMEFVDKKLKDLSGIDRPQKEKPVTVAQINDEWLNGKQQ